MGLVSKVRLIAWGAAEALRLGRPDVALGFLGGLGDDLLCTAAIREHQRRGARRIWFFSRHPQLYRADPRVRLIPEDRRYLRLAQSLGRPMRALSYSAFDEGSDRDTACHEHVIAIMCRKAGLSGKIQLRPSLTIEPDELHQAATFGNSIVVQSGCLSAAVPMANKQWPASHMRAVARKLSRQHQLVQIGSPADPRIDEAVDLRGRTTLRETAALLANARLFVGLVGFQMHLARAVDCPAVIVYGGREPAEFTGYICNWHATRRPSCSPCWQRNRCAHANACLTEISADEVLALVEQALAAPRGPLATEEQWL